MIDLEDINLDDIDLDEVLPDHMPVSSDGMCIRFEPAFDISPQNLDSHTYQIRKTKRSASDIEDLKTRIEAQGQVEPIQIAVINDKNYLIAGEGRVIALRQLNRTAKALVYSGLSMEDITKISFGSNEGRLEMSEWDKIVSIGTYFDKNPDMSKDNSDDPSSLVNIFGLNKSTIYNYLKLWTFFKNKKEFHAHFTKYRCPLYVITGTVEIIKDYENEFESWTPIVEILQALTNRNDISRKTFTHVFLKEITDLLLQVRMARNPLNFETEPLDDPVLNKMEKQAKKDIAEKIKVSEAEQIKRNIEKHAINKITAERAGKYIQDIDKNLDSVIALLGELGELENFHALVHSTILKATMKRVSKVNQLINILV